MKNTSIFHRGLTVVLLMAFSIVLLPKHIFADHDHASVICHETQNHFEEIEADCELCDFLLPLATVQFNIFQPKSIYYIDSDYQFEQEYFPLYYYIGTHPLRGPPIA